MVKLEKWGSGARKQDRPTMAYSIKSPDGKDFFPIAPDGSPGRFRIGRERMTYLEENDLIHWEYKNNRWIPYEKQYYDSSEKEIIKERSILYDLATTADGTNTLTKIFGVKDIFENPKPVELIEFLIKHTVNSEDIILDSFAGTGTTGHAVLNYNKKYNSHNKFILIELEDKIAEEITKVRIERVINGYNYEGKEKINIIEPIKLTASKLLDKNFTVKLSEKINKIIESSKDKYEKIEKKLKNNTLEIIGIKKIEGYMQGIGESFQYCELGEELFDEFGLLNEKITFKMLAKHIYFTEFGIALKESTIDEESFFAGSFKDKALYIFKDKKFTRKDLQRLSVDFNEYIIYADSTTLSSEQLKKYNIVFKKLPFDIKDK